MIATTGLPASTTPWMAVIRITAALTAAGSVYPTADDGWKNTIPVTRTYLAAFQKSCGEKGANVKYGSLLNVTVLYGTSEKDFASGADV